MLINATVAYNETKDTQAVAKALQTLTQEFSNSKNITVRTALLSTGCSNANIVTISSPPTCYLNGTVIPIDKMWTIFGRMLPAVLKDAVYDLYNSADINDKANAVVVVSTMSNLSEEVFAGLKQDGEFEIMNTMTTINLPAACCDDLKRRLDFIMEERSKSVEKSVNRLLKDKYSTAPGSSPP